MGLAMARAITTLTVDLASEPADIRWYRANEFAVDLAAAFERVSRSIRLTIALETRVAEGTLARELAARAERLGAERPGVAGPALADVSDADTADGAETPAGEARDHRRPDREFELMLDRPDALEGAGLERALGQVRRELAAATPVLEKIAQAVMVRAAERGVTLEGYPPAAFNPLGLSP